MKYEDYQQAKWISIYGAYIALKCSEFMQNNKGSFLQDEMQKIKNEAVDIANLALDGEAE